MPDVTYVNADGSRQKVAVAVGNSVMRGAVLHGIDGIVAECGGSCMCATCHVYVEPTQLDLVGKPGATEDEMLDSTACERKPNSRLSCQIEMTAALDGLVVFLPESQV
jgi:2Fe-2S ferredoxin